MNLIRAFQEGGPFMFVILAFGLLTIFFIFERWKSLYRGISVAPSELKNSMKEALRRGDLTQAERLALQTPSVLGKIVARGCSVRLNGGSDEEVQARMDEELSEQIHKMDRRTSFLAVFGNVSTLVGLLGTISGMIHSFSAVAKASPMDRATLLSLGISEAMNCTAFGLIVAVPALIAYAIFQNRTEHRVQSLTNAATEL